MDKARREEMRRHYDRLLTMRHETQNPAEKRASLIAPDVLEALDAIEAADREIELLREEVERLKDKHDAAVARALAEAVVHVRALCDVEPPATHAALMSALDWLSRLRDGLS